MVNYDLLVFCNILDDTFSLIEIKNKIVKLSKLVWVLFNSLTVICAESWSTHDVIERTPTWGLVDTAQNFTHTCNDLQEITLSYLRLH